MNFAVCPDDGTRLKVAGQIPGPGQSLLVNCPTCGKQFLHNPDGTLVAAP
jgi:hypothetical protein